MERLETVDILEAVRTNEYLTEHEKKHIADLYKFYINNTSQVSEITSPALTNLEGQLARYIQEYNVAMEHEDKAAADKLEEEIAEIEELIFNEIQSLANDVDKF